MRFLLYTIMTLYVLFFFYSSCQQKDSLIVGHWKMNKVTFERKEVNGEHNPENNRTISFSSDGRFISGGDPYGENIGKYTLTADSLFLNSTIEGNNSYWTILFSRDTMIWSGVGSDWHEQFKIYHVRHNRGF